MNKVLTQRCRTRAGSVPSHRSVSHVVNSSEKFTLAHMRVGPRVGVHGRSLCVTSGTYT